MSTNYKLVEDKDTNEILCVNKTQSGVVGVLTIPIVQDNTDYQEYLAWVAEGNTADPADE